MRTIKYISPTSLNLWESDRTEFYLSRLAENRPPKRPQTRPMSIGSAFDAYVKSFLHEHIFGKDPEFELETIFESQVDPCNRDWAWINGEYVFKEYKRLGALNDLMFELAKASTKPQFEFTVQHNVVHETNLKGIPILGKPDIFFTTSEGAQGIYDWKVNGYCGRYSKSPEPGFIRIRGGRGTGCAHKNAVLGLYKGLEINIGEYLENVNPTWADQLTIYGWTLKVPVGDTVITGIDQLVCKPGDPYPTIRVAQHRTRVSVQWQLTLFERLNSMWKSLETNHIFTDMSFEESAARCASLDDYYKAFEGDSPKDAWFQAITRQW